MGCDDRGCQNKLNGNHQWIFGVGGKGGAADSLKVLKSEITKKVSIKAMIITLTLGIGPTMAVTAWAWHVSSDHEARICIVENQQKRVTETYEMTKEILGLLK